MIYNYFCSLIPIAWLRPLLCVVNVEVAHHDSFDAAIEEHPLLRHCRLLSIDGVFDNSIVVEVPMDVLRVVVASL